jgi:general secretion pathway protein M
MNKRKKNKVIQKLNKEQQRWLALGLLFSIIVILCIMIFLPWYQSLTKTLEDIDEQVFRIKRYERVIASRDEVLAEVERGRTEINALGYFYAQGTPSLAAAELQKRIRGIVKRLEGDLSSTQVLPNKEQDGLTRIAVKVKLTGEMGMLRNLLHEIEFEKPLMNIEDISIVPRPGRRNRQTRQMEESGKVTVSLDVSSYMKEKR